MVMWGRASPESERPAVEPCDSGWDYGNEILYLRSIPCGSGYRYDPESGLYHVRFRYYHPTLGRWLVRDHWMQYADGMGLYEYVSSDPLAYLDPEGTWKKENAGWAEAPMEYWLAFKATGKDTNRISKGQPIEAVTTIKITHMDRGRCKITWGVSGSAKKWGMEASYKRTYSRERFDEVSKTSEWKVRNIYKRQRKDQLYYTFPMEWETFWIHGGFMEGVYGWLGSPKPRGQKLADAWKYIEIREETHVWSTSVLYGDRSLLKRKKGEKPIPFWRGTGEYRLLRDGQELVGWTKRLDFINMQMRQDHERNVRDTIP
jgi:RHS repeat-associated protein